MRHMQPEYAAIQPWPTKRPHIVRMYGPEAPDGEVTDIADWEDGVAHGDNAAPIIPNDEPVFLLRATDPLAPGLLRGWAWRHKNRRWMNDPSGDVDDVGDDAMEAAVMSWADEMERYAAEHYGGDAAMIRSNCGD